MRYDIVRASVRICFSKWNALLSIYACLVNDHSFLWFCSMQQYRLPPHPNTIELEWQGYKMSTNTTNTTSTTNNPSTVTFNVANDLSSERKAGKSLSLLSELTSSWSSEPVCVKYSLKDERDFVDIGAPTTAANGSSAPYRADSNSLDGQHHQHHQSHQQVLDERQNFVAKVDDKTTNAKAVSPGKGTAAHSKGSRSSADCKNMNYGGALVPDESRMRKREQLLRQCTEYLELESVASRYTKDTFKRGFLNKVRIFRPFHLIARERVFFYWDKV